MESIVCPSQARSLAKATASVCLRILEFNGSELGILPKREKEAPMHDPSG